MGTTLHAIIEEFAPSTEVTHADGTRERTRPCWFEMGTWEFGKNYELMIYLDGAQPGWPEDSDALENADHEIHDQTRQWCGLSFLEAVLVDLGKKREEVPWVTDALEALLAALRVMTSKGAVLRVLWYRDG